MTIRPREDAAWCVAFAVAVGAAAVAARASTRDMASPTKLCHRCAAVMLCGNSSGNSASYASTSDGATCCTCARAAPSASNRGPAGARA